MLALALATAGVCVAQNVFYVSTNGSARADGSAPDKAMKDIQKAIDNATDKIYAQIINLQEAIKLIDKKMVREWVVDLIVNKTFNGLCVQNSILAYLSEINNQNYRLSTPEEESKDIDGFVGDTAYSIKPITYKTMDRLQERIEAIMIYYEKVKTGLKIEVEE